MGFAKRCNSGCGKNCLRHHSCLSIPLCLSLCRSIHSSILSADIYLFDSFCFSSLLFIGEFSMFFFCCFLFLLSVQFFLCLSIPTNMSASTTHSFRRTIISLHGWVKPVAQLEKRMGWARKVKMSQAWAGFSQHEMDTRPTTPHPKPTCKHAASPQTALGFQMAMPS